MIRWTGLAPWEFAFPFPGSLASTFRTSLTWFQIPGFRFRVSEDFSLGFLRISVLGFSGFRFRVSQNFVFGFLGISVSGFSGFRFRVSRDFGSGFLRISVVGFTGGRVHVRDGAAPAHPGPRALEMLRIRLRAGQENSLESGP